MDTLLPQRLLTCTGDVSLVFFFGVYPYVMSSLPASYSLMFLYIHRLCIVFLTISCIGYAMPFILCATICCCLPCIISVMGFREDLTQNKGATPESINALPTYKFKVKKNKSGNKEAAEGGVVAAGTDKERVISGEDAVNLFPF